MNEFKEEQPRDDSEELSTEPAPLAYSDDALAAYAESFGVTIEGGEHASEEGEGETDYESLEDPSELGIGGEESAAAAEVMIEQLVTEVHGQHRAKQEAMDVAEAEANAPSDEDISRVVEGGAMGNIMEKMSPGAARAVRAMVMASVFTGAMGASLAPKDAEAGQFAISGYSQQYEQPNQKEQVRAAKMQGIYDVRSGKQMDADQYQTTHERAAYQKAYIKEYKAAMKQQRKIEVAEQKREHKREQQMHKDTGKILGDVMSGKDWRNIKKKRSGALVRIGFGALGNIINGMGNSR